jgi:hypothetical protein
MPVQIELDKTRHLKFDLQSVRDLEAMLDGKPLSNIIGDITRLGINAITVALYAGLKHEDRSLNINLVTKILDSHIKKAKGSGRNELRIISRALSDAIDETGLFEDDTEGNAQPEPVTPN